ncbi:ORFL204W [Human betaherpesvirus 5]|nr:ORFL204W [Human betaherpesvirus 5]QHX40557.1 ORFL204W [Human betaherpesvirus 5]
MGSWLGQMLRPVGLCTLTDTFSTSLPVKYVCCTCS